MEARKDRANRAVRSARAMAATSHPLASTVAVDTLRAGGSAVDAAIAANALLGLVEPMSCGIGGDLCALIWDARAETLYGLNACGRAPHDLSRDVFSEQGLERIPPRGPMSWTVPGCVDGWFALHERFGRLPVADLLAPTIHHAARGVRVPPVIASMWQAAERALTDDDGARETFLLHGRAPHPGERVRNTDLAAALRMIAQEGQEAFYRGEIADRLVSFSKESGGYFSSSDFKEHTSTWVEPLSVTYAGTTVWELPPSTQGIAVLQMLRLLDGFEMQALQHNSAPYLHLLIEVKKLVYEDRARFYADPARVDIPIQRLLSPEYAAQRRKRLDRSNAASAVLPGDAMVSSDTVYLTVVDEQRNAASLIQSIFHSFGSGMVPTGLGFALQNRGSLFHLDARHPNRLEPGKRPFHTIIPGFVTKDGEPLLSFGVMGGDMQPQGQLQVLLNLLLFGMDAQQAGDALRFRHDGSSSPSGEAANGVGTVYLEPPLFAAAAEPLRARGHHVEARAAGYGGYQGIWFDHATQRLVGGSERRKDGCVLGY